jgi:hypothetical protein
MDFLKTRNGKILAGVVAVLLLVSGYLIFGGKSKAEPEPVTQNQGVQNISPEELGLKLTAKPDNKAVKFEITKISDIKSLEYELVYEADSTAQEQEEGGEPRVQRGITGEAEIESGESTYESEWLDLGSCSRNVCRYDSGVESVTLTLKINKKDGKVYQAEDSLELK